MNCSDKTATEIEEEVKKLLAERYKDAKKLLTDNRDKLDKIAEYLYEKETITGKEFMDIFHLDDRKEEMENNIETSEDETE